MPINPEEITTKITLELDEEEIFAKDFLNALNSFVGLVRETGKAFTHKGGNDKWLVKVYQGSAGFGMNPTPGALPPHDIEAITNGVVEGLKMLERGERPSFFSDEAIRHSISLSKAFGKREIYPKINIWDFKTKSIKISKAIGEQGERMLEGSYELISTVDGYLDTLKAHGKPSFVIFDSMDDRSISCEISEELLSDALEAFRKRVEVQGVVRYRSDGKITSVKAEKIVPFPPAEEIPSLDTIRRIFTEG